MVLISQEFSTRRLIDERLEAARAKPEVAVEMNDIDSCSKSSVLARGPRSYPGGR